MEGLNGPIKTDNSISDNTPVRLIRFNEKDTVVLINKKN